MDEELKEIIKTLERRFSSGNSVEVESARIKREEFNELKMFVEEYASICE